MSRVLSSLVLSLPLIGAYAIFALGIVLIYRASRMLNLAHGAMAMVPAYLLYAAVQAGVPTPVALVIAVAAGGALGFLVEWVFVGRLRPDGPTAQTVGTVAALGLLIALAARVWGTSSLSAVRVFPAGRVAVGRSSIQYGEIGLFVVMLVVGAVLYAVIQRTDLGLMMRGTAESRLAASLMGVNPDRITSLTWMLGGALAALAGILLASVTSLHPYTLSLQVLPAFIAALIGGLGSLPGALVGATVVGVTQGLVPVLGAAGRLQGAPQLFLGVLAVAVMGLRGKRLAAADDVAGGASTPAGGRGSGARPATPGRRRRTTATAVAATCLVVVFPSLPGVPSSLVATANLAAIYSIIGISLVLLTGWVGQISLGHAALVGVGAYATGHAVGALGIPFPFSLPLGAAAAGVAAGVLGAAAVRIRGLYLAVATLVFSWMASEFLFRQPWFIAHRQIDGRVIGDTSSLPSFDFTDRRVFFLVAWAVLGIVAFSALNIRNSRTGRAFLAIRGSEMAAESLGIDVTRYKLLAFVVSGVMAGAAGNLIITDARVVTGEQFTFNVSLFFVSIAVVGGLSSVGGAIASGLSFAGLTEVFYQVRGLDAFLEIVSNLLLAVTLIAYRGGLASFAERSSGAADRVQRLVGRPLAAVQAFAETPRVSMWTARGRETALRASAWLRRGPVRATRAEPADGDVLPIDFGQALLHSTGDAIHRDEPPPAPTSAEILTLARARAAAFRLEGDRGSRRPLVEAEHVTVRFGGLVAVDDVSLEVRESEIVGLIGPNGAGKTTMFNAVAGYNTPASGVVLLYGQDVTNFPVHQRARVGVARTFQLVQLFRDLTVFENLLVATHAHNRAASRHTSSCPAARCRRRPPPSPG
ncbi:MAG: ATP-binding cassette domain-containing protein [Actinomycetota bacterium]|nr:ATP-binding cassette domain-containing protein [Actinomycetota bacterium]